MKQLRILSLVGDLAFGGAESRVLALARGIDQERFHHRVGVLNRHEPARDSAFGSLRSEFARSGLELVEFEERFGKSDASGRNPLKVLNGVVALRRMVSKVRRYIRAHDIDLVDSHLWSANLVGALAARSCGIASVVTDYCVAEEAPLIVRAGMGMFLRCADVLVSDSSVRANGIANWSGARKLRVSVIPNGIETPISAKTPGEARKLLGVPSDRNMLVIGQISGLSEFKGHLVLVDAARQILDQCSNAFFLLVGFPRQDLDYPRRLQARIDELGLSSRFRTIGYEGPIADVWQAIDIHAHASLLDSLPIAIAEGMALGKPAVVTSVGGIPTMVEHGVTGLVVSPDDANALAASLVQLIRDPEFARRLGESARHRFDKEYRTTVMTRRLEALFAETVAVRQSGVARKTEAHYATH